MSAPDPIDHALDQALKSWEPGDLEPLPAPTPTPPTVESDGRPVNREIYQGAKQLKVQQMTEELNKFKEIEENLTKEIIYRQGELQEVQAVIKSISTAIECLQNGTAEQKSKKSGKNNVEETL